MRPTGSWQCQYVEKPVQSLHLRADLLSRLDPVHLHVLGTVSTVDVGDEAPVGCRTAKAGLFREPLVTECTVGFTRCRSRLLRFRTTSGVATIGRAIRSSTRADPSCQSCTFPNATRQLRTLCQ